MSDEDRFVALVRAALNETPRPSRAAIAARLGVAVHIVESLVWQYLMPGRDKAEPVRLAAAEAGQARFLSSRACTNGHTHPERYTISGACIPCQIDRSKENKARDFGKDDAREARWLAEVDAEMVEPVKPGKRWQPSTFIRPLSIDEKRAGHARRVG